MTPTTMTAPLDPIFYRFLELLNIFRRTAWVLKCSIFVFWDVMGGERRVQWLLIVPTVTSLQLTAGESREATEKHGGLVGGWLEDGWRTAWSGQLDYHRQQSNSPSKLYSIDCCDIWGTITARQSWHFLSFNLVSAGRDTGQDLSDCDNKKQINIRHNVSSLNVTAGGEILVSQYFNSKSTVIQTVFPSTKQNDEMIFVIRCDPATVTNF